MRDKKLHFGTCMKHGSGPIFRLADRPEDWSCIWCEAEEEDREFEALKRQIRVLAKTRQPV